MVEPGDKYEQFSKSRGLSSPTGSFEAAAPVTQADGQWPRALGDYLREWLGKSVAVKYSLPGSRWAEARGRLEYAGTNFVAVKSQDGRLFLVELGHIISVELSKYR